MSQLPPDPISFPPSSLVKLLHPSAEKAGVNWYLKRDDLYGPGGVFTSLQGNKVRKLAGSITAWRALEKPDLPILTFGGAYSNHLIALATAGKFYEFPTIGIVRGESVVNPILAACEQAGMELHFISRSDYRAKASTDFQAKLQKRFGSVFIIPEGGSGPLSKSGLLALVREINGQLPAQNIDYVQLAAGTGGTAAGIIDGWQEITVTPPKIEVFPVLKGGWMKEEITRQLTTSPSNWSVIDGYHFGGYAKRPAHLLKFCTDFKKRFMVPIEAVYTGKLFYGVLARIESGQYAPGSNLITYHSGGIY